TWMAIGRLHRLGVAAGVTAAAAWLLTLLGGAFRAPRWLLWWAALYLPSIALLVLKPALAAKLLALLAGLTFPTLGARWAWLRLHLQPPRSLLGAVAVLWVTVGWAVLGGLMVVGLLSQTSYLLAHDTFTGVKLTQLVPLLAAAALVTTGLTLPGVGLAEARASWRRFWTSPVLVLHTVLAMVVLVLVGMLLLRSGNEGVEISETELRFRALLEVVFGARPRTKEFLLGHPALLLAALAAWRGRQAWVAPLYLLGMVGVVSTLNTFCHLHTPLTQSLLRTFHALWLGTVLGLLVYAVARPKQGEG
ncbi:MAG: hypothetical protein HUU35_19860, partial [Armatimonadetes bacterium]|nr:hypothetical protein [Armatimonadota bacterium]